MRPSFIAGLAASRSGIAAVEFALTAPVLAAMMIVVADFGMAAYQQIQVRAAAQAGAEYAVLKGWDSAAISGTVTGATGLTGLTANPAPTQGCGCPSGTAIASATCNSTCPAGGTAGTYVTVNARSSYSTLIAYPGVTSPMTLSATSVVRIK